MAEFPCRWVIVARGGLMGCVATGAMFSLAWHRVGTVSIAVPAAEGNLPLDVWRYEKKLSDEVDTSLPR